MRHLLISLISKRKNLKKGFCLAKPFTKIMPPKPNNPFKKPEHYVLLGLFLLIWVYIMVKAHTVFYIHDEIVTKWAYMINWNPFPYQGYVDANNHFLNSLFGGFFVRLFQDDAIGIIRLANILAFGLYGFSIWAFKRFFRQKGAFYLWVVFFAFTPFILDFFALARGYGLSLALLTFALLQNALFFENNKTQHFLGCILAWLLAVYANMTLMPFALAGILYCSVYLWKIHSGKWIVVSGIALIPLGYLVQYAFHLKSIGKLYLGSGEGFFKNTIHPITEPIWSMKNPYFDGLLVVGFLFILISFVRMLFKHKNLFSIKGIFPLFLILGLANIFGQHFLLDVNYPYHRAALYLVVFFLGAFPFALDFWGLKKPVILLIILHLTALGCQLSFDRTMAYPDEHFDQALVTKMPENVKGIPPATGGPKTRTDNELTRKMDLPLNAFQELEKPTDTLVDYLLTKGKVRATISKLYKPVHNDEISDFTLHKRHDFLPRQKVDSLSRPIKGVQPYFDLYRDTLDHPLYIRCSGEIGKVDFFKEVILVFAVKSLENEATHYYEAIPLIKSRPVKDGRITFDVTLTIPEYMDNDKVKVYLWYKNDQKLNGAVDLDVYKLR